MLGDEISGRQTSDTAQQRLDQVREAYGAAIDGRLGGTGVTLTDMTSGNYETGSAEAEFLAQSFGCGNPVKDAKLRSGERVLDLGCGAGVDLILAARAVGVEGHVWGLDMTPAMVLRARSNMKKLELSQVEVLQGYIEELPLPDRSVDVLVSNCVINLSPRKDRVFAEAFRVLAPGGRLCVSDVVLLGPVPPALAADPTAWSG